MENIILPGEACQVDEDVEFGPGFLEVDKGLGFATMAGRLELHQKKEGKKLIAKHLKTVYFAKEGENVIGVIVKRNAESYNIDINGSQLAVLDSVEFNGATKRNKPNLKVGDLIYAKIASVNKFTAPVLTCKSKTCKKDWTSGESTFGELKHGLALSLHPTQCERLKQDKAIFEMLKKYVSFEVAFGANFRLYLNTDIPKNMVLLSNLFGELHQYDAEQLPSVIASLASTFTKA